MRRNSFGIRWWWGWRKDFANVKPNERKQRPKLACACVYFSDTDALVQTLCGSLAAERNGVAIEKQRIMFCLGSCMLGESSASEQWCSNRRIVSHGTKHTSPLLILVERLPKDNEIHAIHLFKDNYFTLACYIAFMKERKIIWGSILDVRCFENQCFKFSKHRVAKRIW